MKVVANTRNAQGSGASRRLRRAAKVPGIIYGGRVEPTAIELDHNALFHALRVEKFHASVLDMELDGKPEQVLLRNVRIVTCTDDVCAVTPPAFVAIFGGLIAGSA